MRRYLAGVLTLAYSLRKHGNALPLIVMHLDDGRLSRASLRAVERAGWTLRAVERIAPFKAVANKDYDNQCAPTISLGRSCDAIP
jgi:hypothetical protein